MNKQDVFEYLKAFNNPLDKKYRWEVNVEFKRNRITDAQRKELLALDGYSLYELSLCVRNKVGVDTNQVGNFYFNRAKGYNDRKVKKANEKILDFSQGVSLISKK